MWSSFSVLNEGNRSGVESLNCHSEIFKDLNSRQNSESQTNISSSKDCNVNSSKIIDVENSCKKSNAPTILSNSTVSKLSPCNLSKQNEQLSIDDYVKMYGEESTCRNWVDINNINMGMAQTPLYRNNSCSNSQQHVSIGPSSFSDCRLESFWNKSVSTSDNYLDSSTTHCRSVKVSSSSAASTSIGIQDNSKSSDHMKTFDYQAHVCALLPFLQPISGQEDKAEKTNDSLVNNNDVSA